MSYFIEDRNGELINKTELRKRRKRPKRNFLGRRGEWSKIKGEVQGVGGKELLKVINKVMYMYMQPRVLMTRVCTFRACGLEFDSLTT